MNEVYIVTGCRTPIGSFKKSLSSLTAPQLGAIVIRKTLEKVSTETVNVDELFMGQVCQANSGQGPARQAALLANLPVSVPCTTVNKVCASGMKSIIMGSQSIICGVNHIVLAGGQESMSNIPFYSSRQEPIADGCSLIDGLVIDGLTDVYNKCHMGLLVEDLALSFGIDRADQDNFARLSYERSQNAIKDGVFLKETVPVTLSNGEPLLTEDEECGRARFDKFSSLKPAFKSDGTITAANASSLSDGACCVLLASKQAVQEHNWRPVAKVVGFVDAALDPKNFIIAPAESVRKLLAKHNLEIDDIDLWEINEAFSVAVLANLKLLNGVQLERTNVHGGAVAMGHPLGMSGARLVLHLAMNLKPGQKGIAAICNGGGGASCILLHRDFDCKGS